MKRKEINLKRKTPRIVIAEPWKAWGETPFRTGERLLLLGEIQNMKGHVVVTSLDGRVHWGYHLECFKEAMDCDL